jgi:hypothetical protein
MGTYDQEPTVSVDISKAEIERTLTRYGAQQFMIGCKGARRSSPSSSTNRIIQFVAGIEKIGLMENSIQYWRRRVVT